MTINGSTIRQDQDATALLRNAPDDQAVHSFEGRAGQKRSGQWRAALEVEVIATAGA